MDATVVEDGGGVIRSRSFVVEYGKFKNEWWLSAVLLLANCVEVVSNEDVSCCVKKMCVDSFVYILFKQNNR